MSWCEGPLTNFHQYSKGKPVSNIPTTPRTGDVAFANPSLANCHPGKSGAGRNSLCGKNEKPQAPPSVLTHDPFFWQKIGFLSLEQHP